MSSDPQQLDLAALKQQAFAIKAATGAKHCHILEQLARNHGYKSWAALKAAVKEMTCESSR